MSTIFSNKKDMAEKRNADTIEANTGTYVLIAMFSALAYYLASYQNFWSPDSGARFGMVRSLLEHGSLVHWHYPFATADPTGQVSPLGYFLFHRAKDFVPQYEPLFPLVSTVFYRLIGFYGLAIIPLISGMGAVTFLYKTTLRLGLKLAPYIPVAAGLGTPIIIYSVVFWDHSVMMLTSAVAAYFILKGIQEEKPRCLAYAGLAFGVGIFVHELVLAVFLATFLGALPLTFRPTGRKLILGFVAGFLPLLLLWFVSNELIYGSFSGPHLGANMGGNTSDHPFSIASILNPSLFVDRSQEELTGIMSTGVMLSGGHLDLMNLFLLFAGLLALYFYVCLAVGPDGRAMPLLWITPALLAVYLVCQIKWANGLFEATPLIIPALGAPLAAQFVLTATTVQAERRPSTESLYIAWISRSAWIFIFMSIANPMLPGVDWGSRYLLPVLPYLVIMSAFVLEAQYSNAAVAWKKIILGSMILLVGMSTYCQATGLTMIRRIIIYNRDLNIRIGAAPSAVVVYSNIGTGPEAAADIHLNKIQFMVRSSADWLKFRQAMRELKRSDFTLIGSKGDSDSFPEDTATNPSGEAEVKSVGRSYFNPDADEDGAPQVFVHFIILPDVPVAKATAL